MKLIFVSTIGAAWWRLVIDIAHNALILLVLLLLMLLILMEGDGLLIVEVVVLASTIGVLKLLKAIPMANLDAVVVDSEAVS